jgi:hypothetical protein
VPSHLRRRSRDREYARYHATEENEFFPVHNFVSFLKIESIRDSEVAALEKVKSNNGVTFPVRRAT